MPDSVKTVGIFRKASDLPPLDWFAMGCFAMGWLPKVMDHSEFDGEEFDMVVIGGQLTRYDWANWKILHYYRLHGANVIITEGGWLYTPRVPKYWLTYLNTLPYCPEFECPHDRRERLNMRADPKPRGDDILIIGQMPETDVEMNRILKDLRKYTDRKIIYRPRQKHGPFLFDWVDEISLVKSPDEDLARAHVAIAHFSFMGAEALMRGIPVICDPAATFAEFGQHPLSAIEDLKPPSPDRVNAYLARMAYVLWNGEEFRNGEAFRWIIENAVPSYPGWLS